MQELASVEATQSMEVLFTLAGELLFLSIPIPAPLSWCGIFIATLGMILHSYVSNRKEERNFKQSVNLN